MQRDDHASGHEYGHGDHEHQLPARQRRPRDNPGHHALDDLVDNHGVRGYPDDDPAWFKYVDEAELSAEMGHCFRDLDRPDAATQYANQCLGTIDGTTFLRSDFFATMVLADAFVAAGEVEHACDVALQALAAGEQLRSARCIRYLRDFRERLTRADGNMVVRDFQEQARASRLWRIAS
jgi:hypothetical protein